MCLPCRYFLRKLRKVKKANGQILAINEASRAVPLLLPLLLPLAAAHVSSCCRSLLALRLLLSVLACCVETWKWASSKSSHSAAGGVERQ